jgi:hypothetical protein
MTMNVGEHVEYIPEAISANYEQRRSNSLPKGLSARFSARYTTAREIRLFSTSITSKWNTNSAGWLYSQKQHQTFLSKFAIGFLIISKGQQTGSMTLSL